MTKAKVVLYDEKKGVFVTANYYGLRNEFVPISRKSKGHEVISIDNLMSVSGPFLIEEQDFLNPDDISSDDPSYPTALNSAWSNIINRIMNYEKEGVDVLAISPRIYLDEFMHMTPFKTPYEEKKGDKRKSWVKKSLMKDRQRILFARTLMPVQEYRYK